MTVTEGALTVTKYGRKPVWQCLAAPPVIPVMTTIHVQCPLSFVKLVTHLTPS